MMRLLQDIKSYMIFLKVSNQKLADKLHKDVKTLQKQLSSGANPTLATIIEITDALGAKVVLETPESIKAVEDADVFAFRERIRELGAEVEKLSVEVSRLREQIADKDARIERRDKIIEEQKEMMARKDRILDYKEEDIHRKDAVIAQHIKKQEELYEKLMQKGL